MKLLEILDPFEEPISVKRKNIDDQLRAAQHVVDYYYDKIEDLHSKNILFSKLRADKNFDYHIDYHYLNKHGNIVSLDYYITGHANEEDKNKIIKLAKKFTQALTRKNTLYLKT